jgi:hypothetical protein
MVHVSALQTKSVDLHVAVQVANALMVPAVLQTKSVDLHVAVQVANALMVPAVPLPRS